MYVSVSLFHARTTLPASTKFCTDLHTHSGKVLKTSMTLPTQPSDPGLPQTPKPKQITGEKTLCNVKYLVTVLSKKYFVLCSGGPQLASFQQMLLFIYITPS